MVYYSINVMLALVASSRVNGSDIVTFGINLVLSLLSTFAIVLCVYIYNDISDMEVDRINKLDRPLTKGVLSRPQAIRLVTLLGISGLALAFAIDLGFFLFALAYTLLFFIYSFPPIRLKRLFFINKLTVSTGVALTYFMGGTLAGSIPVPVFLLAAYGFVAGITMSMTIDIRDIEGDKAGGIKNPAIVWSPIVTIRLSMAIIGLLAMAVIIVFYQLNLNLAFIILTTGGFAAWIYTLYPLMKRWTDPSYVDRTTHKKLVPLGFIVQFCILGGFLI
jgi:geranylgeranylglycerol-phosphate geranylgeranyltransferase